MVNTTTLANGTVAYPLSTVGTKTFYIRADALNPAELTFLDAAAATATAASIPLGTYLQFVAFTPTVSPSGVLSPAAAPVNALAHFTGYSLVYDTADPFNVFRSFGVGSIAITAGGTAYTSAPAVTFTGTTGGSGAAATAVVDYQTVTAVNVTNCGTGFTSAPTVTFTGTNTTPATAVSIFGTGVTSIAVNNASTGFSSPPTVVISGGGGIGATATVSLTGTALNVVTITNSGYGYTSAPTITFVGGGATLVQQSAATATATLGSGPVAVVMTNVGAGYSSTVTIGFTGGGGGGSGAAATGVIGAGAVIAVNVTNNGSGFYAVPTVHFASGAATATATLTTATTHHTGDDLTAFANALALEAIRQSHQTKYRS